MTDLDLAALRATAEAQARAYAMMCALNGGVGLLGARYPAEYEALEAWSDSTENEHADTVLALLDRLEAAERERDTARDAYQETVELMGKSNDALIGRLRAAEDRAEGAERALTEHRCGEQAERAYRRAAAAEARLAVTDDMVEKAQVAIHNALASRWAATTIARAALVAALGEETGR